MALAVALAGCSPFKSEVPIVQIDTHGRTIFNAPKVGAELVIPFDPADTIRGVGSKRSYFGRIGIELLGHSSLKFPKKSYALELRDPRDQAVAAPLLGLPADRDWVLHGPYSDKTLIRNHLAYALAGRLHLVSPRTRFVELFIRQGAWGLVYQGVYLLVQASGRSPEGLHIARLESTDTTASAVSGGYIVQMDRVGRGDDFFTLPSDPMNTHRDTIIFVHPQRPEGPQKEWLAKYFESMEEALPPKRSLGDPRGYSQYLDVDSFVDFLILQELVKNVDAYRFSMSMHKGRDDKLRMGPVWDFDLSMGNANYDDGCDTDGWLVQYFASVKNAKAPPRWWRRLLQDRSFADRVHSRWVELRAGPFASDSVRAVIDDAAHALRTAQKRNFERWPILGRWVWPNCLIPGSQPPANYQTWEAEVSHLTSWMQGRLEWMDANIGGIGP